MNVVLAIYMLWSFKSFYPTEVKLPEGRLTGVVLFYVLEFYIFLLLKKYTKEITKTKYLRSKTIFILFDRRVKTRKQERSNEEEESCMVNDYFSCNLYVWKVVLLTHPDRTWTYICPTL